MFSAVKMELRTFMAIAFYACTHESPTILSKYVADRKLRLDSQTMIMNERQLANTNKKKLNEWQNYPVYKFVHQIEMDYDMDDKKGGCNFLRFYSF